MGNNNTPLGIIRMVPAKSMQWTETCKECSRLIKGTGFQIYLSVAWDSVPDDKFFLCKRCATIAYPNYFKKETK